MNLTSYTSVSDFKRLCYNGRSSFFTKTYDDKYRLDQ